MKKLVSVLLFLGFGLAQAVVAQESALTGQQLKQAVAGKTVYVSTPLGSVPIRYSANGTISARTDLALLDGEKTTSDRGRWWVSGDRLCIRWQNWMDGRSYCFSMQKTSATSVRWQRHDGKTGTARIGS
jgi:hypothetical protein